MANKNISIDDLARMLKRSFDSTDKKIEKEFKNVNTRLDRIETLILKQHSHQIEILEKRVMRLEDALAIKSFS